MKIVLNLQFLTCKKYSEHRSTVKNCNFSKLQFFKCTSTVIPLHIFAVQSKFRFMKIVSLYIYLDFSIESVFFSLGFCSWSQWKPREKGTSIEKSLAIIISFVCTYVCVQKKYISRNFIFGLESQQKYLHSRQER